MTFLKAVRQGFRTACAAFLLFQVASFPAEAAMTSEELAEWAEDLGVEDGVAFAAAIETIRVTGGLPHHYILKAKAKEQGWQLGKRLDDYVPGGMIGGDRWFNRGDKVPRGPIYWEADLDTLGARSRGRHRILFSSRDRQWLSVDRFRTLHEVPR